MISFLRVGSMKLSLRRSSTSLTGDRITLLARSRDSNQDITTSEEMLPLHLLEQELHPAVHRGQALPALLHHQLHPDSGQSAVRGGGSDLEGDRPEHSHEPAAAPHLHIGRVQAGGV